MDCSIVGFPVLHCLLEFAQTHVHWVSDAIQSAHPLFPSFPAPNLSQHHGLFQWASSSHQVAKVLELQYWSRIASQCCVSFCCIAKWISFIYIYKYPLFSGFPSHLGPHRVLKRVPCAIQLKHKIRLPRKPDFLEEILSSPPLVRMKVMLGTQPHDVHSVCRCVENLTVELWLFCYHKQTRSRVPVASSVFSLFLTWEYL